MSPRTRRQNRKWFQAAIGVPVGVVIGLMAAGTLAPEYGVVVLLAQAPAWYVIWSRLIREDRTSQSDRPMGTVRPSLLTPYAQSIIDVIPDALVLVDPNLRVMEANNAARKLFGVRLAGRDFTQILRHPDAVDAMDRALRTGAAQDHEVMLLSPGERHFIMTALPIAADSPPSPAQTEVAGNPKHAMAIALHEVTALKRSEQMRADFVANASHELRTPLASLIGFIETLQGPAQDDKAAHDRFLAIMADESARMVRLIDDLLSLSKIELDEHVSPSGLVDVRRVVEASAKSLGMKAEQRAMTVQIELDEELPLVVGDADQLTQVFQNLIDNAIKYGREGTAIRVTSEPVKRLSTTGGPALAVTVHNEGQGIEREHLPRLTDRFYRVDPARSRKLGGTGLGLAIVKHIVNRHQGRLVFNSTPGVGTDVTVSIPLGSEPANSKAAQKQAASTA